MWCSTSYGQGRLYHCLTIASHVLTPQVPVAMLHLQRHLLASDARDDIEIMYQERHARDWSVGKLILMALERIYSAGLYSKKHGNFFYSVRPQDRKVSLQ